MDPLAIAAATLVAKAALEGAAKKAGEVVLSDHAAAYLPHDH